jgi:hypothetical protein
MKEFASITRKALPSTCAALDRAWAAHQPHGKIEDRVQQFENAVYGDAEQTKRQRNQPNDWVKHKSYESQGPAEQKQNAPQEESNHLHHLILTSSYVAAA